MEESRAPEPALSADNAALVDRADAARRAPSTRSDLTAELDSGIALTRSGDKTGPDMLREVFDRVATYPHVAIIDGEVYLSMYVRSLIDSAHWLEESGVADQDVVARVQSAIELLNSGERAGVEQLEAALGTVS